MIRSNLIKYIQHTPYNFNPTIFNELFDSYISHINHFYKNANCTKLEDYLYTIEYDNVDYDAGAEYMLKFLPKIGGCSSVYKNGIYGRNYDWLYDNTVSFITHVNAHANRHESYGISAVSTLDKNLVETGTWSDLYAILPNLTLDGINDAGVTCNINVAPTGDYGFTTGTNKGKPDLCALAICRFVLDNANSVDDAITKLKQRNIWMPRSKAFSQEVHFMIADKTKCVVIEFINNKMVVLDKSIMTNFYLYNVKFNQDGSVYTPYTQTETENAIITNHITPYGCGLERYNLINSNISLVEDKEDMLTLMKELYYTYTYTTTTESNIWYTELVGNRGLTVTSTPEQYAPVVNNARNMYNHRDRAVPAIWQTVHTSIYDIENKSITVVCQEGNTEYTFNI